MTMMNLANLRTEITGLSQTDFASGVSAPGVVSISQSDLNLIESPTDTTLWSRAKLDAICLYLERQASTKYGYSRQIDIWDVKGLPAKLQNNPYVQTP
jgi:hypothetical protein